MEKAPFFIYVKLQNASPQNDLADRTTLSVGSGRMMNGGVKETGCFKTGFFQQSLYFLAAGCVRRVKPPI